MLARKATSANHGPATLATDVTEALHKRQHSAILALDTEQAFDRVRHEGLIHKMRMAWIPIAQIKITRSYLKDRIFRVKIEKALSTPRDAPAGVPQRSYITPLVYNVYLSDFPPHPSTKSIIYADDILIYSHSHYPEVGTPAGHEKVNGRSNNHQGQN